MLSFICVIVVALANAEAFTHEDANSYIDGVLLNAFATEAQYSRLDPYKFPDVNVDLISKRITENKAQLTKGKLINLSKAKRSTDCTVPYWSSANVSFTCFLTFDRLLVNYTANATYDNMQIIFYPTTSITGTNLTIQVTTTPEENIPNLRMLIINNVGKMDVTTKMISIGDVAQMIGPSIREAIVKTCVVNLHKIINGRFKDALGYSIYKTQVPFA